jgi:hypothetical protein
MLFAYLGTQPRIGCERVGMAVPPTHRLNKRVGGERRLGTTWDDSELRQVIGWWRCASYREYDVPVRAGVVTKPKEK